MQYKPGDYVEIKTSTKLSIYGIYKVIKQHYKGPGLLEVFGSDGEIYLFDLRGYKATKLPNQKLAKLLYD